jgi:flavin-dependent dehydrogenase
MSEIEGGAANVCLLAREPALRGRDVPAFLAWMRDQNPRLREWLAQAEPLQEKWLCISQIPFLRKGPLVGDVLMAGDAAGLIAPLAGDGIAMALRSGALAAARTRDFLDGRLTARRLRRSYASAWRREFGTRLILGRALQALMLRPRLLSRALRALDAAPSLGDYLVARTRGC